MTQESELLYRSNLESVYNYLAQTYGDSRKIMLVKDVCNYTGNCFETVKKRYFKKGSTKISAESFARVISKL